jgi:hypothetical protein
MHFFRSREDAESWAADRNAVAILSAEEGLELAQWHWVERYRRACH